MEPCAKTFCSLCAQFSRHCVLAGETRRRALPCCQSNEMKVIYSTEWESNPQSSRLHSEAMPVRNGAALKIYNIHTYTIFVTNLKKEDKRTCFTLVSLPPSQVLVVESHGN